MNRKFKIQYVFITWILVYFMFGSNAFGINSTDFSRILQMDYKTALKQTQESQTEFWEVQLQALSSEEARNVQGKYRLIDGIQWEETQFVAVKALEGYLKKINAQSEMKKFFPEVHSKLEQVTKIWIERRSGLRPKRADADSLPGDLRNQYPEVVAEAISPKSLRFKTIILDVSKKLPKVRVFKPNDFQMTFEFYFNYAMIQSIIESNALTPLEQKNGRLAIKDKNLAEVVLKKYTVNSANQFNKKVGDRYLSRYPDFKKFQQNQLMLLKSYLQQ